MFVFKVTEDIDNANAITIFSRKPEAAILSSAIASLFSVDNFNIILNPHKTQLLAAIKRNQSILMRKPIYVYNIGGIYNPASGCFDCGNSSREMDLRRDDDSNGKYSSAGLMWHEYGTYFIGMQHKTLPEHLVRHAAKTIDNDIIRLADCGELRQKWSFLPPPEPTISKREDWMETCRLARDQLLQEIQTTVNNVNGHDLIKAALQEVADKQILVLPRYLRDWRQSVLELNTLHAPIAYVILPHKTGKSWRIEAMLPSSKNERPSKLLPEAWRGLCDSDLVKATGVSDAQYCSEDGLHGVAKTNMAALQLATLAVNS